MCIVEERMACVLSGCLFIISDTSVLVHWRGYCFNKTVLSIPFTISASMILFSLIFILFLLAKVTIIASEL